MTRVVPSIIPQNIEQMTDEINLVAPFADLVQVDISDGIFASPKTWPYNGQDTGFFEQLKKEEVGWPKWEDVDFEVHLMVKNPEAVLEDWIKTGVTSVVVHIETTENFKEIIDICREHLVEIWIAIKPSTDISKIASFVSKVDGIQCMGSDLLGKHGMELEERSVEKIKKLRTLCPDCPIGVDIGVNLETKDELLEAGATKFVCGSAILEADDPKEVFDELSQ